MRGVQGGGKGEGEGEGEERQAETEGGAVEMRGFDDAVDVQVREYVRSVSGVQGEGEGEGEGQGQGKMKVVEGSNKGNGMQWS